jgi:hypothetical protein
MIDIGPVVTSTAFFVVIKNVLVVMFTISRNELYRLLTTEKHIPWLERYQRVYLHLDEAFGFPKDKVTEEKMKRTVRRLCGEVRKKWVESHRIEKDFLRNHGDWLEAKIVINIPRATKKTTKTAGIHIILT